MLRFPLVGSRDIPLYISFTARQYSNRRQSRTAGGGNLYTGRDALFSAMLPVPINMTSASNIDYDRGKTNENAFIEGILGMGSGQDGGGRSLASLISNLPFLGGFSPSFLRDLTVGGNMGLVDQDRGEMLFNQAQFRTFQFNFSMVAKNSSDAQAASDISNGFETFSYPQPDLTNQSMLHPPLWQWYVLANTEDGKISSSKLWAGQPQTSVLSSVTVNRTGAGGAYSVDGKPLVTNLSLTFTELEPNLQLNGNLLSRSAALTRPSA